MTECEHDGSRAEETKAAISTSLDKISAAQDTMAEAFTTLVGLETAFGGSRKPKKKD